MPETAECFRWAQRGHNLGTTSDAHAQKEGASEGASAQAWTRATVKDGCGFSTETCEVGWAHALPQRIHTTGVWAGQPVGPAACSHFTPRLGSKLTFSTGPAMLLLKTNTFLERLLQLFLQDGQDMHVCEHLQVNLHLCECLCVYICVLVHLIANRHSVDLIILKPPPAIYKETVGQQWNQCRLGLFHTRPPHNLIHNNENLISHILKVSAHLWSHFNKHHSQHLI